MLLYLSACVSYLKTAHFAVNVCVNYGNMRECQRV